MLDVFRHIVHAAGYSMAGFAYLLRSELSARIEMGAVFLAILWFLVLGRPLSNYLILVILACLIFSLEALNTAIEVVVDRISPEHTNFGRIAKDLGSTSVFFTLLAGSLYIAAVTADAFGLLTL